MVGAGYDGIQSDQSFLQNLPPEILAMIFQHLAGRPHITAPLSRTLAPFVQANLFREFVGSYQGFVRRCKAMQGAPHLARLAREVHCNYSDLVPGNTDYHANHESLHSFFESATALKSIRISSIGHLFLFHMLCPRTVTLLGSLEHLATEVDTSIRSSHFRFLPLLPKLKSLDIAWPVWDDHVTIAPFEDGSLVGTEESQAEISIGSLTLRGGHDYRSDFSPFLCRFRCLTTLVLEVNSGFEYNSLGPILEAVQSPQLKHLSIAKSYSCPRFHSISRYPYPFSSHPLYLPLHLFPQLTRLQLLDPVLSDKTLACLSQLTKLERLEFQSPPDVATLRQLLTGPNKIPRLSKLVVPGPTHVRGALGLECRDEFKQAWQCPSWNTVETSQAGAEELVEFAKMVGVELSGGWVEAVQVGKDYDEELTRIDNIPKLLDRSCYGPLSDDDSSDGEENEWISGDANSEWRQQIRELRRWNRGERIRKV